MPSTDQPGNTHSTPMPDELENGPWHSFVSAQGWLHCGIPGAAASGALKAMMQEFERVRPHPRVK